MNIFNSVPDGPEKEEVLSSLNDVPAKYDVIIAPTQVIDANEKLSPHTSAGPDGISPEAVLYASKRLHIYLSILFNAFLTHAFLPDNFMNSRISPIVKDKNKYTSNKSNYRPIAVSNVFSKFFEIVLCNVIAPYISSVLSDNQFGFRNRLSTELCIF